MSLGIAVFASVVLVLAVYHQGFRKVLFWTVGVITALILAGAAVYFGHERYITWQTERAEQKQKVAREGGTRTCMARLGTPMQGITGTKPETLPSSYYDNLAACIIYPDLGWPPPPAGFIPDNLPTGYMLDAYGKVTQAPPGTVVVPKYTIGPPKFMIESPNPKAGKSANPAEKARAIEATISCDVVVYDRSDYGEGDPQAIDSLHDGDTVQYVGHVTVGDQDIIKVHGRKGYVSGCVEIKR